MPRILPAIIPRDRAELSTKLDLVRGVADWVQIDVMDGIFVPPKTWPYTEGTANDAADFAKEIKVEIHLMTQAPEKMIADWIAAKVSRVLVHPESTAEMGVIVDMLRGSNTEFGIALKLGTSVETVAPWMNECRAIQLMSIGELGYHGHPFEERVFEKIEAVRTRYPNVAINIDGGVTSAIIPRLIEAGVENIVVGGAIFNTEDSRGALQKLVQSL